MLHRSQLTPHANRAPWALQACHQLNDEVGDLEDVMARAHEMVLRANHDDDAYDPDLDTAGRQAAMRREMLIASAVIHGAAAIEGAFHGLAVCALGSPYASALSKMSQPWRWRVLIHLLWGEQLSLGEPPLSDVGLLFASRNWLMHPNVIDIHTGEGVWEEVTIDGVEGYQPVDLTAFTDKVDQKWLAARTAALGLERTFRQLADTVDGFDPSAGLEFELFRPAI